MILNGRYYLNDIEIGIYEVSKEVYEDYYYQREQFNKRMNKMFPTNIGRVFVVGTMDGLDNKDNCKQLWKKLEKE